jgi:hypothetical protein
MFGITRIPNLEIKVSSAICVISQLILFGYRVDWFGGGGYGPRYFIELIPIFALGFVCLGQDITTKSAGRLLLVVCAIGLIVHQSILLYSVEHASDGWIDLARYLNGQSLGLDWQVKNSLRLIANPGLWLAPRPYVAQERQTVLVNFVAGVRDLRAYLIPGTGVALMAIVVIVSSMIRIYSDRFYLPTILESASKMPCHSERAITATEESRTSE